MVPEQILELQTVEIQNLRNNTNPIYGQNQTSSYHSPPLNYNQTNIIGGVTFNRTY